MWEQFYEHGNALVGWVGVSVIALSVYLTYRFDPMLDEAKGVFMFWVPTIAGVTVAVAGFFSGQVAVIILLLLLIIVTPCRPPTY